NVRHGADTQGVEEASRRAMDSPEFRQAMAMARSTTELPWELISPKSKGGVERETSSGHSVVCRQPAACATALVVHRAHPLGADQPARGGRRDGYPPPRH